MYRRFYILFLIALFTAFLYGCHSDSYTLIENGVAVEDTSIRQDREIDAEGRLSPIKFNSESGATIEVKEAGTMQKGVRVTVEERKTANTGINPLGEPTYIYLYVISATLETTDSLGKKTLIPVYSLEKPLTLTLSTGYLGTKGVCYAGIRKSEFEAWKYIRLSGSGTSILNLRAASNDILLPQYSLDLYEAGIQVALFLYNPESAMESEIIAVDSLTATNTAFVACEGNVYREDLEVGLSLDGLNLDKINPSDVKVIVTYKNKRENNTPIKANNILCVYENSIGWSDEAVSGKGVFVHSFIVKNMTPVLALGKNCIYNFTINLNGLALDEFPSDFTVGISCESKNKNQIPFSYSKLLSFEPKEKESPLISYKITYNLDDGKLPESNPESYDVTSATIILKNPTKAGYTFLGWTGTGIEGEASTTVTIPQGSTGDREYTANFTPNEYTITCDLNGGMLDTDNPTSYRITSADIVLNNPTKEGYTFIGWTGTDLAEYTKTVTIEHGSTGNRDYIANFTANSYTISYDLNGGSVVTPNPESYDITSASITLNNPIRTGYTFVGWTGSNGDVPQIDVTIEHGSTENKSYKANFTLIAYNITYVPESAKGDNPASYTVISDAINLVNPFAETGYCFLGWFGKDSEGNDITEGASQTVTIPTGSTGDREYSASFTPINYTISYDLAGGTLTDLNPESYDITSATIILNNPVRDGYDFLGWTASDTLVATTTVTIAHGSTGNRVYTAHWAVSVMTFTLNGGVALELRHIPAGSFVRGIGRIGDDIYGDGLTVNITKDFYMGTFEVTQKQYQAVMNTTPYYGDNVPADWVGYGEICASDTGFLDKINTMLASELPEGYRFALPTEAQWEYACRAGTTTDLNNGYDVVDEESEDANANAVAWNYYNTAYNPMYDARIPQPVGQLASNSFGLYDMHGNVWEWCYDMYASSYDPNNLTDPTGPAVGDLYVIRGGSCLKNPIFCTSWIRSFYSDIGYANIGFRLVLIKTN